MSLLEVGLVEAAKVRGEHGRPVNANILRSLRILRVVRIFNKLESMHRILAAISSSIKPVLSAFMLFGIVISIFAMLGSKMFRAESYGAHAGEYFGSYSLSFVTLLGIATGDSWVTEIHEMLSPHGHVDPTVAVFFVVFILVVGIVALNIIVAVLLEGFMNSIQSHEDELRSEGVLRELRKNAGFCDALLDTLSDFSAPQHLDLQLELIFSLWDTDDNKSLDFEEAQRGFKKLGYDPPIEMSREDWQDLTLQGCVLGMTLTTFNH